MSLTKSAADVASLRKGGLLLASVLEGASKLAKPGVALRDLNTWIDESIRAGGGVPSFLGYQGYPAASCLSLNAEVVHGIPDGRILKEGDILGIDVGIKLDGRFTDAAVTVPVGKVAPEVQALLRVTYDALHAAIAQVKPGRRVGVIGATVLAHADAAGLGVVRALTGHGVGHAVHEAPEVPNAAKASDGMLLQPGMVLAIEPMLTTGSGAVYTDADGWTIVAADAAWSAQYERTVVVTQQGCEILTPWNLEGLHPTG